MSGRIQRAVIVELTHLRYATTLDLCRIIYRDKPISRPLIDSMDRRLNKLAKKNIVKRSGLTSDGRECWTFIGKNVDYNRERQDMLRTRLKGARALRLVKNS